MLISHPNTLVIHTTLHTYLTTNLVIPNIKVSVLVTGKGVRHRHTYLQCLAFRILTIGGVLVFSNQNLFGLVIADRTTYQDSARFEAPEIYHPSHELKGYY